MASGFGTLIKGKISSVVDPALGIPTSVIPGPQGESGEDGEAGVQGIQGATGLTGATGSTGAAGAIGSIGPTGYDGEDGADGMPGLTGATGSTGATGEAGAAGATGGQGSIGPPGLDGEDADSFFVGPPNSVLYDFAQVNSTPAQNEVIAAGCTVIVAGDLTVAAGIDITTPADGELIVNPWPGSSLAEILTHGRPGRNVCVPADMAARISGDLIVASGIDYEVSQGGDLIVTDAPTPITWRPFLTGPITYYVSTLGLDTNDGITSPFLTIQKAVNVASALDNAGYNIFIQVADGTYTGAVTLKSFVGSGAITIQGNRQTPTNVIVSTTSANGFTATSVVGTYAINDLKITTATTGSAINAAGGMTNINISGVDFGTVAAGYYQIISSSGARVVATGNYTISGGGGYHVNAISVGAYSFNGKTVTISGTPAFTAFVQGVFSGNIQAQTAVFTGSATGQRYNADNNATIYTAGGGANFFPGNSAGAVTNGGVYT